MSLQKCMLCEISEDSAFYEPLALQCMTLFHYLHKQENLTTIEVFSSVLYT